MNRSRALRSTLAGVVIVLLAGAAWLTFAPSQLGGGTELVATRGDSMAPLFRTGDLAVIRPRRLYHVGDVVAYRSTLLHSVVLHRIIGRSGDRYVLKGDSNDFVDPNHPDRSQLVGELWVRVPRGGVVLTAVQRPLVAGALLGGATLLLLLGSVTRRRRRRHTAPAPLPAPPAPAPAPVPVWRPAPVPSVIGGIHLPPPRPVKPFPAAPPVAAVEAPAAESHTEEAPAVEAPAMEAPAPVTAAPARRIDGHRILQGAAIAAALFALAGLVAFTSATTRTTIVKAPYAEKVTFGYHATPHVGAGPVYPGGALKTGDPVFLRLVDRVSVGVGYRLTAGAPHHLAGSMDVVLRLTSPTGWTRDLPLAPATPFDGDRADSEVTIDLAAVRRLTRRVERLTGMPTGGSYTLAVIPRLNAEGTVAGRPLTSDFAPQMSFQLDGLQLRADHGLMTAKRSSVAVPRTVANSISIRDAKLPVTTARWIALGGLALALLAALVSRLNRFRRPQDPSSRVNSRHGHLLVPIVAIAPHPGRTPIDVTTIDALVALAERAERLILHHRGEDGDTYLVEDGGTLFRFCLRRPPPAGLLRLAA